LLQVRNLSKSFSGIMALDGVQLQVGTGEVHALLGENGAGKSTLLKALSGAQPQTSGDIIFNGKTLDLNDSPHARQLQGIVTIYQ
ncbi:ATP-binding cassette domain-containing protein, partial [Salmonella sp. ZJHZ21_0168]|uniref:ATP-binding cassette domain-containing protein n=1 Tax=Salmonella sp. ZJHZ21_0168 TaxID=3159600 RepID=UPI0039815354